MNSKLIVSDPEIMGGVPVFVGTRVPVSTLFDYLQHDHDLDSFLGDFPSVTRNQAQQVLAWAQQIVSERAA